MEVKACSKCKNLFNYISGDILCPRCKEQIEEKFKEVKRYLIKHKEASVSQISKDCEVEEKQIRKWIREERLEVAAGAGEVTCENCGTPIKMGRYCDKCKATVITDLKSVSGSKKEKTEPADKKTKMRYFRMK